MSDEYGQQQQDFEQADLSPELQEQAIHPKGAGIPPVFGAVAAAAVGAAVWGAIAHFTGYEVGYVAWGIGAAVGGGAALLGGRGSAMGMTCAALALASILGGKLLAIQFAQSAQLDEWFANPPGRAEYDTALAEGAAFAEADSDVAIKGFMIEHGYTEASAVPDVNDDELAWFEEHQAPDLLVMHEDPPTFEEWQRAQQEQYDTLRGVFESEFSPLDAVKESLSAYDLLFAALGVFTAFRLGSGSAPDPPARRGAGGGQSGRVARKRE